MTIAEGSDIDLGGGNSAVGRVPTASQLVCTNKECYGDSIDDNEKKIETLRTDHMSNVGKSAFQRLEQKPPDRLLWLNNNAGC